MTQSFGQGGPMTEKEKSQLLRDVAKTKGGALLVEMISEAALRRMTGDPVKIQQQSGVFNLWLDLNEYLTGEYK